MKKLLLLALTAMMMVGCRHSCIPGTKVLPYDFVVVEIDSCEYIGNSSFYNRDLFSHKGNCKYCAERRKQELKELIKELKDK